MVKSANPDFKKATVRINIYRQHRQTIQVYRTGMAKDLPHFYSKNISRTFTAVLSTGLWTS